MTASVLFGYALLSLSAVLLAHHWHELRRLYAEQGMLPADRAFHVLKLERRSIASSLIGVVGGAIALAEYVPHSPRAATVYLFGILILGAAILLVALADLVAMRRRREEEQLNALARDLAKNGLAAAGARGRG